MEPTFLQAGETPLSVQRRHPLSALDNWLGLLVAVAVVAGGAFALGAAVPQVAPLAPAIAVVAGLLGVAAAIAVWFRVVTSLSVITPDRVYHAHGRLRFFLAQTTYDRVTDLHVHQSLFGRWFGFGTVLVQTAGHGVRLVGVRDPLATKRVIEEAREAMVRRLVAGHRQSAPVGEVHAKAPSNAGAPLWRGGPTLGSVLSQMVPLVGALVVAFLVAGPAVMAGGRFGLLLPGLMLLYVGAMVARGFVQYRTLRYEIHPWGVAVTSGWLSRSRTEARYEKVTDVAVTQGVLGRFFGFGSIRINTAGGSEAPVTFSGVRQPDQVKAIIDGARQGSP